MNGYLVPANAKKGTLIFNIFRPFDLLLFSIGVAVSLIALAIVPSSNIIAVTIAIIPGCVCGLLVFPIPNYHNVRTVIKNAWIFYTTRQKYIWKGWCLNDGETSKE